MTEHETREMLKEFATAITTGAKTVAEPLTRINANLQRIEAHLNQLAATHDAAVKEVTRLNNTLEATRDWMRRVWPPRIQVPGQ